MAPIATGSDGTGSGKLSVAQTGVEDLRAVDGEDAAPRRFFIPASNAERRQVGASLAVLIVLLGCEIANGWIGPRAVAWTETGRGPVGLAFASLPSFLGSIAYSLPSILLLATVIALRPTGDLARAARPLRPRLLLMLAAIGVIGLASLYALGARPFGWEIPGSNATVLASGLFRHGQLPTVVVWFAWSVCLVPVVEEVGVRYGLLRFIARRTDALWAGVVASSLLFGLFHLGNVALIDGAHILRAISMVAFGLLLGAATVWSNGNISAAIILHATYNAVSLAALFSQAAR